MIDNREVRVFKCKLRTQKEGDRQIIAGYAAVFDKRSEDLGGFREIIKPGTFKKTIQEADVRALFNHDANYVLGRNTAGTLRMKEDKKGLRIIIDPPDATWANDLKVSMARGDVDQMSFGFTTVKDAWVQEEGEEVVRELHEVRLFDVSIVTYPAYPDTEVGLRSFEKFKESSEKPNMIKIMHMKLDLLDKL